MECVQYGSAYRTGLPAGITAFLLPGLEPKLPRRIWNVFTVRVSLADVAAGQSDADRLSKNAIVLRERVLPRQC